ncbi:OLC1v1036387C1 [Oldenlandia corymbosa var. corymbosa]|uniref:OLC1v1036387C1 n=1 Tax=Oldenlandia corymbosa var. corymbosa TaxID=529605 RepID=A0AAV1CVQ1_OLDCO|nr:OLC1v1036387C1 [Oldenlandia corymbosa var. corymbosa]
MNIGLKPCKTDSSSTPDCSFSNHRHLLNRPFNPSLMEVGEDVMAVKAVLTRTRRCVSQTGSRWWLSKIVDPAYRLIASGATKILRAFLSTTPSVNALSPPPAIETLDGTGVKKTVEITKISIDPLSLHGKWELTNCDSPHKMKWEPSSGFSCEFGLLRPEGLHILATPPSSILEKLAFDITPPS